MSDQNDRDESEPVRLTTEKNLRYRFDDICNKSSASGDEGSERAPSSGELDLDHVCGAVVTRQSIRTLLHVPVPEMDPGQRDRDLTPASFFFQITITPRHHLG